MTAKFVSTAVICACCCLAAPRAHAQQKLDAELKGIALVGVVVEDLSADAAACGLKQDAIERAATKILTDSGLKVIRNSDNDTYLYLAVVTRTAAGVCFSRYDAYLYTHATTALSYQPAPVLVQVSLAHEGGLGGSGAATHGDSVVRSLMAYVQQIADRVKRANQ
jgi:hypothetical protein